MRSLIAIILFGAAMLALSSMVEGQRFGEFRGRGRGRSRGQGGFRGNNRGGFENLPICECDALDECQATQQANKAAKKAAKEAQKESCELECDRSSPVTSLNKAALMACKPERRMDRAAVKTCIKDKLNPVCDSGSGVTELEGDSGSMGGFKRRGGWMRHMMKGGRGMRALLKAIDQEKHADLVEHKMCIRACMRENRPERQRRQRCFRQLQCRPANTNTRNQKQQAKEDCRGPKPTAEEKTQKMVGKCQCAVNAGITLAEGQTCDNVVQIMQERITEIKERFGRGKRQTDSSEEDHDGEDESSEEEEEDIFFLL